MHVSSIEESVAKARVRADGRTAMCFRQAGSSTCQWRPSVKDHEHDTHSTDNRDHACDSFPETLEFTMARTALADTVERSTDSRCRRTQHGDASGNRVAVLRGD